MTSLVTFGRHFTLLTKLYVVKYREGETMNRQINPVPETPEKKIPSVGFSVLTISVIAVFVGVCVGPLK